MHVRTVLNNFASSHRSYTVRLFLRTKGQRSTRRKNRKIKEEPVPDWDGLKDRGPTKPVRTGTRVEVTFVPLLRERVMVVNLCRSACKCTSFS
jgi:hypothetical protein